MSDNRPDLDVDAVARWLAGRLPGFDAPVEVNKFETGQSNPTYGLATGHGRYVLRRKPHGVLLKSAHAVDREFRVQSALASTDVPVAKMHAFCDDAEVIGAPFYIMDWVAGRTFNDPAMPGLTAEERSAVADDMNRVLTAIHGVNLDAVGLADYGPRGNYYRRQIDRWTKQYRATETEAIPDMDALIRWLDAHVPQDDGRVTLVHGDYRLDNLLIASNAPRCVAVLDWELSTLCHPFADLAGVIMQWSRPPGEFDRGLAGVDRKALGLPEDRAFVDAYCARAGLPGIERFNFYLAFCFFRMGAILQGVKRRALDGNASNPDLALRIGAPVPDYAKSGVAAALNG